MKFLFVAMLVSFGLKASVHEADYANLNGKIKGKAWSMVSGRARPSQFAPGKLELSFWDQQESAPCDFFTRGSDRQVIGTLPKKVAAYNLGPQTNLTIFFPVNQNLVVTVGKVAITKIENNLVHGSMSIKFDNNNLVSGTFAVPLCK